MRRGQSPNERKVMYACPHDNPLPRKRVPVFSWTIFFLISLFFTYASPGAATLKSTDCLDCHLDPTTTRKVDGKVVSLIFPTNGFAKSVHSQLDCVDCHEGIKEMVHPSKLPPPNCGSCHEKEG